MEEGQALEDFMSHPSGMSGFRLETLLVFDLQGNKAATGLEPFLIQNYIIYEKVQTFCFGI